MKITIPSLFLVALLCSATSLLAQSYTVHLSGHVSPCTPLIAGGQVNIVSDPNVEPPINIMVPLNANCYYSTVVQVISATGGFQVSASCMDGTMASNSGSFAINVLFGTDSLTLDLQCGGPPPPSCQAAFTVEQTMDGGDPVPFSMSTTNLSTGEPPFTYLWFLPNSANSNEAEPSYVFPGPGLYDVCLTLADAAGCTSIACDSVYVDADGMINTPPTVFDCLQIPNGPNMPGTECTTPALGPGTWTADCECIPNVSLPCEAAFWVMQAYTWTDTINNPGGGGIEPIPFELWVWNLSNGGTGNYQFFWDFGDGNTSTDPFPTHIYGASGPYNLCLTITDDAGCEDTYCETINVDEDGNLGMAPGGDNRSVLTIHVIQELPTGIAEQPSLETTNLWPNPVEGTLNLSLRSSRSGTLILTIIDMNGKVLRETSTAVAAGNNLLPLDVSGLARGLYVLRLNHGNNSAALRFVKD